MPYVSTMRQVDAIDGRNSVHQPPRLAMRAAAEPAQINDHGNQQPQKLIPAVGMPLLSSHAYTIVVSGRKMKPSTGNNRPPWNARCK